MILSLYPHGRRYMAEILPIRRKTLSNQSINIPPWTKFRGYIGITLSVCLTVCLSSVCLSVCLSVHNFFLVWHWLTIFDTWVYHHVLRTFMIQIRHWTFTSRSNLYDFWHVFVSGPQLFFLFDIGLPYLANGSIMIIITKEPLPWVLFYIPLMWTLCAIQMMQHKNTENTEDIAFFFPRENTKLSQKINISGTSFNSSGTLFLCCFHVM